MKSITVGSVLLLSLPLLVSSPVSAGGLEGRLDSRVVGSTSMENITNGYRNISFIKESRSSWEGESLTAQTTSTMTLQLDGLLTSALSRFDRSQSGSSQDGAAEQASASSSGLVRDLVRLEDPVFNLSTSTGASQSRIKASGSDYSLLNAHMVDSFNSSSSASAFGVESSSFGQTF